MGTEASSTMVMNNYPDDNPLVRTNGEQSAVTVAYSDSPDGDVSLPPPVLFDGEGNRIAHRQAEPIPVASVTQGSVQTVDSDYAPDFWLVQCSDAANVQVDVYLGNGRGLAPHARLGANWGRTARLPGRGIFLTLVGVGSQAVTPLVTAYHGWGPFSPDLIDIGS